MTLAEAKKIIKHTIELEGGFVDNKSDRGGMTKFGITKASYPNLNIAALTYDKAVSIYMRDFMPRVADINCSGMRFFCFDTIVSGQIICIGALQSYINGTGIVSLKEDAKLGPMTIAAINKVMILRHRRLFLNALHLNAPALARRLNDVHRERCKKEGRPYVSFEKGWCRRISLRAKYAMELVNEIIE